MSTAHALLGLLDRSPAYGYSLKQDFDRLLAPERPLAFGQVYSSLARFERQGWAEILTVESGSGPERKLYGITPDGVTELETWISAPQATGAFAASTLFVRISIALLSGRDAQEVLTAQRESHMVRMRELTSRRRGAEPALLLQLDYELTHLDADLRWIQEAGQRLDALRTQWQGAAGARSDETGEQR